MIGLVLNITNKVTLIPNNFVGSVQIFVICFHEKVHLALEMVCHGYGFDEVLSGNGCSLICCQM